MVKIGLMDGRDNTTQEYQEHNTRYKKQLKDFFKHESVPRSRQERQFLFSETCSRIDNTDELAIISGTQRAIIFPHGFSGACYFQQSSVVAFRNQHIAIG